MSREEQLPSDHFCRQQLTANGFTCFVITGGGQVVHCTFSEAAHQAALAWLEENRPQQPVTEGVEEKVVSRIRAVLEGRRQPLPPLSAAPFLEQGTPFQRQVWEKIAAIPYGGTKTYGELAAALGRKGAARAVGQACHANPVALFIPCHRVVGAGETGGFAGGREVKKRLLLLEQG